MNKIDRTFLKISGVLIILAVVFLGIMLLLTYENLDFVVIANIVSAMILLTFACSFVLGIASDDNKC